LRAREVEIPGVLVDCVNLEGMWVTSAEEIEAVRAEIAARLAAIGDRVHVIVNYDNFYLAPDLMDEYTGALRGLAERYYASVTRYTTSSFLRLKLGDILTERSVSPHIHMSREEAVSWLGRGG
jgi:propionate CoA-transferase